jgi:aminoglycoside phosphotransferase (APT) family kinase protein
VPVWDAEVAVGAELAAELVGAQFPELAGTTVEPLGEGWDNVVYLLGGEWVFRFPRRQVVVAELEKEIAFLPRLAPLLPVRVPVPELVGRPTEAFRWPFSGARYIEGAEACDADASRALLARDFGRVLRILHSGDVRDALPELPENWTERANMATRVPWTRDQLARIAGLWTAPPVVEEILSQAATLPPPQPRVVCHGDLHFRHLLVHDGRLHGLIDWIDLCRGEPALDLLLVWSFFTRDERDAFLAEYGEIDDDTSLRARTLAFSLNGALAEYAHAEGLPGVEREALAGLTRAASP